VFEIGGIPTAVSISGALAVTLATARYRKYGTGISITRTALPAPRKKRKFSVKWWTLFTTKAKYAEMFNSFSWCYKPTIITNIYTEWLFYL
jgi:hypothetical protein